jgi:hypothetical protein
VRVRRRAVDVMAAIGADENDATSRHDDAVRRPESAPEAGRLAHSLTAGAAAIRLHSGPVEMISPPEPKGQTGQIAGKITMAVSRRSDGRDLQQKS